MPTRFSFHDKRVTLQLARLSTVADQNQEFAAALNALPSLNFDVYKLSQEHQEVLFAEFDVELERNIKGQFEADSSYLLDLGNGLGSCPLCGHEGCRYIFRITNNLNGKTIECGSDCIITHGLCVKGAETAEHARKALEATIRRHIRKLKIEAWHKETGFNASLFNTLADSLMNVAASQSLSWRTRNSARCKARYDLPKLVKFYDRTGWLNTKKRWAEWSRLVNFARQYDEHISELSLPFEASDKESAGLPEMDADVADLEQKASDEAAYLTMQEAKTKKNAVDPPKSATPQSIAEDLPFNDIASELVFD